jgi:transposase
MPDELWIRIESLLPARPAYASPKGGRPRLQKLRPVADAIFYKMRTGCQWNAIPRLFGASSTIHDYFQQWVELGIFERMWELALNEYEELRGTSWKHQSLDTASVKAPLGGKKNWQESDGSGQAWKQTLRPGRRPWRAAQLRNSGSECTRRSDRSKDFKEEEVPASKEQPSQTNALTS